MKNETFTGSIQEIADKAGIEYAAANMILKFLAAKGIVKEAGQRKRPDGRGKAAQLYSVPLGVLSVVLIPS